MRSTFADPTTIMLFIFRLEEEEMDRMQEEASLLLGVKAKNRERGDRNIKNCFDVIVLSQRIESKKWELDDDFSLFYCIF